MQQAARVADMTAFFSVEVREDGTGRHGILVEYDADDEDLHEPVRQAHRGLRHGALRMRTEYQASLDALGRRAPGEGEVVRGRRGRAVDAMQAQDVELCDEVIAFDDEIDVRYHRIERSIEEILAQQAPVATDLRLVLAVLHNSIHLERIGDQSVTIAKLTKLSADLETRHDLVEGLARWATAPEQMVRVALDSFAERDVVQARGSSSSTSSSTARTGASSTRCSDTPATPGQLEWGMRMIVVARCIERIGDNAVDIGEQTAFLVTGEFTEFTDASH